MTEHRIKPKITTRDLRIRAASRGFLTIGALAHHIGCSRPAIYFAIERPSRYSRVYQKILEAINEPA